MPWSRLKRVKNIQNPYSIFSRQSKPPLCDPAHLWVFSKGDQSRRTVEKSPRITSKQDIILIEWRVNLVWRMTQSSAISIQITAKRRGTNTKIIPRLSTDAFTPHCYRLLSSSKGKSWVQPGYICTESKRRGGGVATTRRSFEETGLKARTVVPLLWRDCETHPDKGEPFF